MEMENDISMIKYLLLILAASFLFACAAQAQTGKQITISGLERPPVIIQKMKADCTTLLNQA
jgi:uncharacterized lipoprotein YajG